MPISRASSPAVAQKSALYFHCINLTPSSGKPRQGPVAIAVLELIAYSQHLNFTRLNLRGGKVLDVKETTDEIDGLVRRASAESHSVPDDAAVSRAA